jgi:hypothetical protein
MTPCLKPPSGPAGKIELLTIVLVGAILGLVALVGFRLLATRASPAAEGSGESDERRDFPPQPAKPPGTIEAKPARQGRIPPTGQDGPQIVEGIENIPAQNLMNWVETVLGDAEKVVKKRGGLNEVEVATARAFVANVQEMILERKSVVPEEVKVWETLLSRCRALMKSLDRLSQGELAPAIWHTTEQHPEYYIPSLEVFEAALKQAKDDGMDRYDLRQWAMNARHLEEAFNNSSAGTFLNQHGRVPEAGETIDSWERHCAEVKAFSEYRTWGSILVRIRAMRRAISEGSRALAAEDDANARWYPGMPDRD